MGHDSPGETRPRSVRVVTRRRPSDGHRVDPGSDDREERWQQRHRGDCREKDDDRPGDPDRAEDHELEEDESQQAQQDCQAGEEDGPAGRRNGRLDGARDTIRVTGRPGGELLSKAAGHERREIQDEDAHRGEAGDDGDRGEGDDHRRAPDDQRNGRRDD